MMLFRTTTFACAQWFHVFWAALWGLLFNFHSRYSYAIGLNSVFSLGRSIPPAFTLYSQTALLLFRTGFCHRGFTVCARSFQNIFAESHL